MEVEKIKAIQEMNQEPISLETPVGSEEDSELGDFVEDQKTTSPYEATNRAILREELDGVLKTLSPREEKVLRYRYGLMIVHLKHWKKLEKSLMLPEKESDK